MYIFLVSGTIGMNKAIWNEIDKAKFGAVQRTVKRPMHDWEVCCIDICDEMEKPYETLKEMIGERLMKRYTIQID